VTGDLEARDSAGTQGSAPAGLPKVFDPRRRPWIELQHADSSTVTAQVERCPSGALSWVPADKGRSDARPPACRVRYPIAAVCAATTCHCSARFIQHVGRAVPARDLPGRQHGIVTLNRKLDTAVAP
jgi:hypothetical protein